MIQKLIDGIRRTGAPVVVGLDPNLSFIPQELVEEARQAVKNRDAVYEDDLEIAAEAVWHFNKDIIDAVADLVLVNHNREHHLLFKIKQKLKNSQKLKKRLSNHLI